MPTKKELKKMKPVFNKLTKFLKKQLDGKDNSEEFIGMWDSNKLNIQKILLCNIPIVEKEKIKDLNAPKKPKSSYLVFCNIERDILRKQRPDIDFKEISRELGKKWKLLSDIEKKGFNEIYEKDKERYNKECQIYVYPNNLDVKNKVKSGIKKPRSSYMFFCQEERIRIVKTKPNIKQTEIMRECGKKWNELSSVDKKTYENMYEKDKERYRIELEHYNNGVLEKNSSSSSNCSNVSSGEENKVSISNNESLEYNNYCKENRSIIKGKEVKMSNALINKKLKEIWNSLSDTDKSKYKI
jgi:hypothetical protein